MRVLLALVVIVVLGCTAETPPSSEPSRVDGPWQAAPVPFDAAFALQAAAACGRVRPGLVTVLHDLRGASTDILVSAGARGSGYCIADPSAGGGLHATEGSSTDDVRPMLDPETIAMAIDTGGPDANGDRAGSRSVGPAMPSVASASSWPTAGR